MFCEVAKNVVFVDFNDRFQLTFNNNTLKIKKACAKSFLLTERLACAKKLCLLIKELIEISLKKSYKI